MAVAKQKNRTIATTACPCYAASVSLLSLNTYSTAVNVYPHLHCTCDVGHNFEFTLQFLRIRYSQSPLLYFYAATVQGRWLTPEEHLDTLSSSVDRHVQVFSSCTPPHDRCCDQMCTCLPTCGIHTMSPLQMSTSLAASTVIFIFVTNWSNFSWICLSNKSVSSQQL